MFMNKLSGLRRAIIGGLAAVAVAVPLSVGTSVIQAERADANSWLTISVTNKCYTYSFGRMCVREVTQLRNVSYCTSVPISQRWVQTASWTSYCIRYTSSTYWP